MKIWNIFRALLEILKRPWQDIVALLDGESYGQLDTNLEPNSFRHRNETLYQI